MRRIHQSHFEAYNEKALSARFCLLFILLTVLVVYAPAFKVPFLWDDEHLITKNLFIRSWKYLPEIFLSPMGAGSGTVFHYYRPLQALTYLADFKLWGLNPAGFHLTNLLLHASVAMLFWCCVVQISTSRLLAITTAILFAVHPVHSSAVIYVSGRSSMLTASFTLLTLLAYWHVLLQGDPSGADRPGPPLSKITQKVICPFLVFAAYLLALLAKETALALLPAVFALHFVLRTPLSLKGLLALFLALALYLYLRFHAISAALVPPGAPPLPPVGQRVLAFFAAFYEYLRLMVLPGNLHLDYGWPHFAWSQPQVSTGFGLLVLFLMAAFYERSRNLLVSFGLFWYLSFLLPVSGIVPLYGFMAEHHLYMPSLGIFLIVGTVFVRGFESTRFRPWVFALWLALALLAGWRTRGEIRHWQDPVLFYKRMIQLAPHSFDPYNNLATLYLRKGEREKAKALLQKALVMKPESAVVHFNLAGAYLADGQPVEALRHYEKARRLNPEDPDIYNQIGLTYQLMQEPDKAEQAFVKAIEIAPYHLAALNNLALHLARHGNYKDALLWIHRARKVMPGDIETRNNAGVIYFLAGDKEKAEEIFEEILRDFPSNASARANLEFLRRHGSHGESAGDKR